VQEVLDTYSPFTEISERLQGIGKGSKVQEQTLPDAGATSMGKAAVGAGSESGCRVHTPFSVYQEAVTVGMQRGFQDARSL